MEVLPANGSGAILTSTAQTVTLSGAAPAVKANSIIVSGTGEGLLRKVVSRSTQDGNTVLTTEQGSLDQVFEQADIRLNTTLGAADFQPVNALARTQQGGQFLVLEGPSGELKVTFADVALGTGDKAGFSGKASLSGSASIKLDLGIKIDYREHALKELSFVPSIEGKFEAKLKGTAKGKLFEGARIKVGPELLGKPILRLVGPIPIVFTPVIQFYALANGDIEAGFELASSAEAKADLGLAYKDGRTSPVAEATAKATLIPKFSTDAGLTVGVAPGSHPEIKVRIFGVEGPYLDIDAPLLEAEFKRQSDPPGFKLAAKALFKATVGFRFDVVSVLKLDLSQPAQIPIKLFEATFLDGQTQPTPGGTAQPTPGNSGCPPSGPTTLPANTTGAGLIFDNTASTRAITDSINIAGAQSNITPATTGVHIGLSDFANFGEQHILVLDKCNATARTLSLELRPNSRAAAINPTARALRLNNLPQESDFFSGEDRILYNENTGTTTSTWRATGGSANITNVTGTSYIVTLNKITMVSTATSSDSFVLSGSLTIQKRDLTNETDAIYHSHQVGGQTSSGTKIAFQGRNSDNDDSGSDIYVIDAAGSHQKRLTTDGANSPNFSIDGKKLLYVKDTDGSLYTANADGSNKKRIADNINSRPKFSPDGNKITYAQGDIYVMNADGSNRVRVTTNGSNYGPSFSPDGKKIIFQHERSRGNTTFAFFSDIHTINVGGSGLTQLTTSGNNYNARFSPDGAKIVFDVSSSPNSNATGADGDDIYIMNANGSGRKQLTFSRNSNLPSFSPDGKKIVFNSNDGASGQIYVMNIDGSGRKQVTSGNRNNQDPTWTIGNISALNSRTARR